MKSLDVSVLAELKKSAKALGAYDVAHLASNTNGKVVHPNSVYRALRRLVAEGLVHNVVSLNAFVAAPAPDCAKQLLMICNQCGGISFQPISQTIEALNELCTKHGFVPDSWCLEIIGQCADCAVESNHLTSAAPLTTDLSHRCENVRLEAKLPV